MSEDQKYIKNRSEILFLYDVKYANPNGDPMEENKPRIDEETGINIVTDVRLKRTIRDYLAEYKGKEIFVKGEEKEPGKLKTREDKLSEIKQQTELEKLLREKYIDLRLFGATITVKKKEEEEKGKSFTWIGPVQFRFGKSLHKVEPKLIKGTTVLPSREEKAAGTFTETWVVPYSLICFYGVVNENNGNKTGLTEDDLNLMYEAMWNGTKNLITRSKFGHMPRFLLVVTYEEKSYHIGDLDRMIKIKTNKKDEELRDISELKVDLTELINILKLNAEKIKSISIEADNNIIFLYGNEEIKGKDKLIKTFNKEINKEIKNMNINL
ncbi:MAG: type I-B CRISPR-associated protein Cas7/Csh2 [Thermoprotei archaeon]|jgi:CRISPR-associated protein Csh2